ncbi:MAG TPA: hypothetical protein VEP50_10940 [bacterium]|nr:hypothetical protein [bacterium]
MNLFIVEHREAADECSPRGPKMGAMLLKHLSPANAKQHGLTIHGAGIAVHPTV